ncbi:NAD(P)/FAD-dependent oxidoreductase [Terricaulis silvestris]|uniref:Protoporphyrinogen oxidase n=1 Tax=Terricaulis silvestris TaxID=2686094 RepID=A0A6I6MM53_9CAUL|nr:NAD(P)/FAD-dependent oxidoreductase [Terricaulis silvestris]QGZ96545.1 Protoporphyrinogen oxidase [Terricaulis silvestris]
MAKVIVIGAGPMGLAAAYEALKRGHEVDLLEASDRPGGMAAHFDFDGLSIERFYHFCCLSDRDTIALLDELGLNGALQWVSTKMGYFVDGKLYRWGDPFALLTFPKLGLVDKIRYGVQVFLSTKRSDWQRLDKISAKKWFTEWLGEDLYNKLWRPLLELKFYELTDKISAAWVWQRIKRLGNSRKSLLEERLGYIEGGSETLVKALVGAIENKGGRIRLKTPAKTFLIENGAVRGVETASGETIAADFVVSTAPMPLVPGMLSQAPELRPAYERMDNVGVVCVLHKLKRSVSDNFWINISDPDFEIPGLVEFSNLRPLANTVVYVPYYMPATQPKWGWSDEQFVAESWGYLKRINPALADDDRLASHVGRLRYAQPVCEVGFAELIPPAQTPIKGLQIADTCFYYPEDRGVSESIRYARNMIAEMGAA